MGYFEEEKKRKKRIRLIIAGVLVLACCIGFIPFAEYMSEREQARIPTKTPTPTVTLTGRLVLLGTTSEGMVQLYSLAGDMTGPTVPLGDEFPGDVDLTGPVRFVSPSGNLAVVMSAGEVAVLDLTSGERRVIVRESPAAISGAFSPDDRYLALGTRNTLYMGITDLLLFDLSTNAEPQVIYDAPSARYGYSLASASGTVWDPLWLDAETLIFSSYIGDMPEQITTAWGGPAHEILPPNSTSLVRVVEGEITHRIISQSGKVHAFPREGAVSAGGVLTAFYIPPDAGGTAWVDLTQLKQGEFQDYQPFAQTSEWYGRVPNLVSPDGRYAVFFDDPKESPKFHLVEISTGSETYCAFSGECLDPSWSPDMQSLACRFMTNVGERLVIHSFSSGRYLDLDLKLSDIFPWRLLTWQP